MEALIAEPFCDKFKDTFAVHILNLPFRQLNLKHAYSGVKGFQLGDPYPRLTAHSLYICVHIFYASPFFCNTSSNPMDWNRLICDAAPALRSIGILLPFQSPEISNDNEHISEKSPFQMDNMILNDIWRLQLRGCEKPCKGVWLTLTTWLYKPVLASTQLWLYYCTLLGSTGCPGNLFRTSNSTLWGFVLGRGVRDHQDHQERARKSAWKWSR